MKHIFKTLLGLVLVVFVLAGCSNPAGPETPEVNESPVVETPEEVEIKFKWCTWYSGYIDGTNMSKGSDKGFTMYSPMYLLDLHFENGTWVYDLPGDYEPAQYLELMENTELFRKFSNDAFEEVFGTKRYKKGEKVDLRKWTSEAINLIETNAEKTTYTQLHFLTEDVKKPADFEIKDSFNEIIADKDMVIYIYWSKFSIEY